MSQTKPVPLINGTLVLNAETLRAAHIEHHARVIVQDRAIIILPEEVEADVAAETFASFTLPKATARYLAENKDIEYDL